MIPSHDLLRQSLRFITSGIPPVPSLSADWQTTLKLAADHHLEPVVAAATNNLELPKLVSDHLKKTSRDRRIRTMLMTQEFAVIHKHFQEANIQMMPLKGIVWAHTLYQSPTHRYFNDLDLLVHAGQAQAALEVLRGMGYRTQEKAERPDWHHLPPQQHPASGIIVEIHTDLIRRDGIQASAWSLPALWQRAQPASIAGCDVKVLEDIDSLIYVALHARHHLFDKPTFLVDGVLLAQRITNQAELLRRAQQAGAMTALGYLMEIGRKHNLSNRLTKIPAKKWRLKLSQRINPWDDFTPLPRNLRGGALPKLAELLLMDSWADSWRMARALLKPNQDFVEAGYPSTRKRLWQRSKLALKQLRNRKKDTLH